MHGLASSFRGQAGPSRRGEQAALRDRSLWQGLSFSALRPASMHSDPLTLQKVFSQQVSGLNEAWRGQRLPSLTEVKQRNEEAVLVRKPGPGIGPGHSETVYPPG